MGRLQALGDAHRQEGLDIPPRRVEDHQQCLPSWRAAQWSIFQVSLLLALSVPRLRRQHSRLLVSRLLEISAWHRVSRLAIACRDTIFRRKRGDLEHLHPRASRTIRGQYLWWRR